MYKLQPDDIQGMLAEAARVLTQPKDKEVMRRLVSSTRATPESEWDRNLIAQMLAKAGKMHEAEMVVHDIELGWQRADALLAMSKALNEVKDDFHARSVLRAALVEAQQAQESENGNEQDKLDASAVLTEVACFLHELGDKQAATNAIELVRNESRKERFYEYISCTAAEVESSS